MISWEAGVLLLAVGWATAPCVERARRWIRNWRVKRRAKRQVPMSALHCCVPAYATCCRVCAKGSHDEVHLHPYNEPLTINNVSVPPASGTLGELAYEVFQLDMGAVVYEATGFPMTVFVELDQHVETAALREKVRRAVWWVKSPGILVVIVGHGALRYDVSDEERWLKEASK